jgi:hypothetical protein
LILKDKISVAVISPGWVATDSGGVGMANDSKRPKALIDPKRVYQE